MSFRSTNQRILAPAAQTLMIFGIISLCQPWSLFLHQYGVTLTLIGLVAFLITSKIAPDPETEESVADDGLSMPDLSTDAPTSGSKTAGPA
jgi:hypothetical protein